MFKKSISKLRAIVLANFSLILIILVLVFISATVISHSLASDWTGTFVNTTITGNNVTLNSSGGFGSYANNFYSLAAGCGGNPQGFSWNGTNWLVVCGADGDVYFYNSTWAYTGNKQTLSFGDILDIYSNDSSYFIYDQSRILQFSKTWINTVNFTVVANGFGIGFNGSNWFVSDESNDKVWKYNLNWTLASSASGNNWSIGDTQVKGIYWDGNYWWLDGATTDTVQKYYPNWTYAGYNVSISAETGEPRGIKYLNGNWWLSDLTNNRIRQYNSLYASSGTYTSPIIDAGSDVAWNNLSWIQSGRNQEGWDYSGINYPSITSSVLDINWNGSDWFLSDVQSDIIIRYLSNWTYEQNWSLSSGTANPYSFTWNGSNWFVINFGSIVSKYNSNFVQQTNYSVSSQEPAPYSIAWNGSSFFIGGGNEIVYRYLSNWTYANENYNISGILPNYISNIEWHDNNWWAVADQTVYKFYPNFTYTGKSYSLSSQDTSAWGIANDGNNWWMSGDTGNKVYKYDFNLKFQTRSCDDALCSGETLVGPSNTSTSYFTSSPALLNTTLTPNNRYFQYKTFFLTGNTSLTPHLAEVNITYTSLYTAPTITLNRPLDNEHLNILTPLFNGTYTGDTNGNCWLLVNATTDGSMVQAGNHSNIATGNLANITSNITLSDGSYYLWGMTCRDGTGVNATSTNRTIYIDTTLPVLTWTTPNNLNTSAFNSSFNINIGATDLGGFWSSNFTIRNATSNVYYNFTTINSTSQTSLTLTDYINITSLLMRSMNYTAKWIVCDPHTNKNWNPDASITTIPNGVNFKFDNTNSINISVARTSISANLVGFDYNKETDRYSFNLTFNKVIEYFDIKVQGKNVNYITSNYKGHLIIDNKYWFDTEPYSSQLIEKGDGYIILRVTGNTNKFSFNSLGALNCITEESVFLIDTTKPFFYGNTTTPMEFVNNTNVSFKIYVNDTGDFSTISSVWLELRNIANLWEKFIATLIDPITHLWETNVTISTNYNESRFGANDTLGNINYTSTGFPIDTIAPVFTNIANQTISANSSFSYLITATESNQIGCFTVNDTTNFEINCSGYLTNKTATNDIKIYNLNVSVNDTTGNIRWAFFWVNITNLIDYEYPIFSNFLENPANASTYLLGRNYQFNWTAINTNGSCGIEFNGVNFTSNNISTIFNSSIGDLSGGTYSYYPWCYGNGTLHNYNRSEVRYYTLNKSSSNDGVYINGTRNNVNYDNRTKYLNLTSILLNGTGNTNMYFNESIINGGDSHLTNETFNLTNYGIGSFNVTGEYYGNANYTAINETWILTISLYTPTPPTPPSGGGGGGGSGVSYNYTIICKNVYYFLIDHMDKKGFINYSDSDLDGLVNKTSYDLGITYGKYAISQYINNFSMCQGYLLPSFTLTEIPKISEIIITNCSLDFMKFNIANWYIPTGKVNLGNSACQTINNFKWLFKYEKIGDYYYFIGLRVYPFLIILFIGILFCIVKFYKKSMKHLTR